jgi:predicted phage-related endonuclease
MGVDVVEVAFVEHPEIAMFGCSPDGLVGEDGLVEIKAPNTATHLDTLLTETVPGKYITQMQVQMACTGREWCDFVSFDPRLPESMALFVKRVPRDVSHILELETEVAAFIAEIDDKVARLTERYASAA